MAEDLYRETIIRRYQSPRNRRAVANANAEAVSQNPLCGDEIRVEARIADDCIADLGFSARGCSISQASADMMADVIRGRTLREVAEITEQFRQLMDGALEPVPPVLEELAVLQSVRKYPVRVKCALLPWETLRHLLDTHQRTHGSVTP